MSSGDFNRALLEFRNAAAAMPKDPEPRYQIGLTELALGNTRQGIRDLQKVTEVNPGYQAAQVKLSELMVASGDSELEQAAEKRLLQVIQKDASNVAAVTALASAEYQLGRKEDGMDRLQQALDRFPQNLGASVTLARLKLAEHDLGGAEEVLKKAVGQAPQAVDPVLALGAFYLSTNQPGDAQAQFERVLKMEPQNASALIGLATLAERSGGQNGAEELYRRISALPDRRYRHLHATFLLQQGRTDAAISEFQKLARADSGDRDARTRLVSAYLIAGRTPDARKLLDSALKANAEDVDALLQRAEILLRENAAAAARKDLNLILHYRPDSADAHFLLAEAHRSLGEELQQRTELYEALRLSPAMLGARIALAQNLLVSKTPQTALEILNQAPSQLKQTLPYITERNWVLLSLGDLPGLTKGIQDGLSQSRTAELLLQDSLLKLKQRDFKGGRSSLEEALQLNPEETRALSVLGASYAMQQQAPLGLQKLREHAARWPKSAIVQEFVGETLLSNGAAADARSYFVAAKAASPKYWRADLSLAQMDFSQGKLDESRKRLVALAAANKDLPIRLMLADVESASKNYAHAIELYKEVVDATPNSVKPLNDLAYLLAERAGRPDEALPYAERAAELEPDDPSVQDTLGWIYYRKGLYSKAADYLKTASAKANGSAVIRYHLAMAYSRAGKQALGQQTLAAALKMDPNLPEAEAARQVLQERHSTTN